MPYPYDRTIGEQYEHDNNPASPFYTAPCADQEVPTEGRARIKAGWILDDASAGPYGRVLRPVTLSAASQYGSRSGYFLLEARDVGPPYVGRGGFRLTGGGPYGRYVEPYVSIGCRALDPGEDSPGFIVEEFDKPYGVIEEAKRFHEIATLQPFLDDDTAGPHGRALRFKGVGECPGELLYELEDPLWLPDGPYIWTYGEPVDAESLYHFDVFGKRCVVCPILFWTAERPCIDCSYPPEWGNYIVEGTTPPWLRGNVCHHQHSGAVTDYCAEGGAAPLDLGDAHCIPYDRIACDVSDGVTGEHHCEECVFERNLGFLIRLVLDQSDCLSKIPLRPVRYDEPYHNCSYGCGAFGWTLWSASGAGLRIPWEGWPAFGPDEWDDKFVTIQERPCSNSYCYASGLGHESGFQWCGSGLECRCDRTPPWWWCTTTHQFRWDRFGANSIRQAYLCFRQWEACNRVGQPCPSDLNQGVDVYHNPYSQLMVWVEARIVIGLEFLHWGPLGGNSGGSCGCCDFGETAPDRISVKLIGEFCGPVPWGAIDDVGWAGFESNEFERQTRYPGTFYDRLNSDLADHHGSCGAMFVDQGSYGDGLDGQGTFFREEGEPPRRCPSRLAGPKFWCPPFLRWRWSYTEPTNRWETGEWRQPNQRQARNQCWALQPVRNDGDGCAGGRINSGGSSVSPVGCHDPNCRRGCASSETKDEEGYRVSPWRSPRATPWGCGHCVTEYPIDPLAQA